MAKKLVVLGLALAMLFPLVACNTDSLADYKSSAKATIQAYADAKGRDNYPADSWVEVCNAVVVGKHAVEDATTKPQVDDVVVTTKENIDKVESTKERILPMDGAEEYTVGNGTEAYPYVINTTGQLIHFSNQINKGEYKSAFFALGCDIDLEGTEWTPIGILANKCFNGVFDGRGYEVSNLCITHRLDNSSAENVGLFGRNTGTIRNVGVTNFDIDISWAYKFGFVLSVCSGGLVGSNAGHIENSYTIGNINLEYYGGATITAPAHIRTGGLVGYNTGKLTNCYSTVDVNAIYRNEAGTVYAAGLTVGGIVKNCLVKGNVNAEHSYHTLGGERKVFSIGGECFNSYSYEGQKIEALIHPSCSDDDLNNVGFYTRELSWDADIWDLENLDFTNGKYADNKHPRLK